MAKSKLETIVDIKHKYRYITTMTRYAGTLISFGRLDALAGQVFLHESAGNKTPIREKDYVESHALNEISLEPGHGHVTFLNPPSEVNEHYTHYTQYRTKNTIAANADFGVVDQTFIYNNDIPVVKMGFLISFVIEPDGLVAEFTINSVTFNIQDIGSIITSETGIQYQITSIVSNVANAVTIRVTKSDFTAIGSPPLEWYFIGAIDYFICNIETGSNGTPLANKSGGSSSRNFLPSDVGKQIYWHDGHISIINGFHDNDEIALFSKDGLPDDIDDSGDVIGVIGYNQRCYNDVIDDSVLTGHQEARSPLFFLQTRNFSPLPNGSLGAVKGGAYFVSTTNDSQYFYSQVGQFERTGSFHPTIQLNTKPVGALTRLAGYPEALIIFGKNFTYYLDTNIEKNGGEPRVGELILAYVDPREVTTKVGCPYEGCAVRIEGGGEIIFTNEPAVRVFDGYKYSKNIALNRIQESEITQLSLNILMEWDKRKGLNIWGVDASST